MPFNIIAKNMALCKPYEGIEPIIDPAAMLAENATIVGDVVIGAEVTVWYQAVMRGDVGPIRIGARTNIQDGAMLHCSKGLSECHVGDEVVVGHKAILHGCRIEDRVLIGMGAIILDNAIVETGCIIAAGAVVTQDTRCEAGWLYAGVPAKKLKPVSDAQKAGILDSAARYVEEGKKHFGG